MKFSQRMGITPTHKQIQVESLDNELRNTLWNIYAMSICDPLQLNNYKEGLTSLQQLLANHLWHNIYKKAIDTKPYYKYKLKDFFRETILTGEWYQALELIEETTSYLRDIGFLKSNLIYDEFNKIFEREFSAYRFVDGLIAPISNKQEIESIEDAISQTAIYTSLNGCNIHLRAALGKLSDKVSPDYRNSIKESISAVESIVKVISDDGNTLGKALKVINRTVPIHPSLITGFSALYGYTNDSGGIRHALMSEDLPCDFEDAKYMLVSCSAFINYLISKVNKAGISIV